MIRMVLLKLSYAEAVANSARLDASWPRAIDTQKERLIPFCLPNLKPSFSIAPDDLIFTIGSCFARNVEQHLILEGFNVAVTRFDDLCNAEGVRIKSSTLNKFVAQSILNELRWALDPDAEFPWDSIVQVSSNRYLDMQLAAGLMPAAKDTICAMRRAVLNYMGMIKDAKVIIITLGLAEAWFDKEYGIYMNSMPLRPTIDRYPDRFELHVLDYNGLVETLREIIILLETYGHPDFRMLITVSPVALSATFTDRDAMVANCYSKSVQRAAAEAISRESDRVDYLPSYESVTLSDRSLAWREDQAHVTDDAVRLNVIRMQRAYGSVRPEIAPSSESQRATALTLIKDAAAQLNEGNFSSADSLFAAAVKLAPDEVLVRLRWGLALHGQDRFAEAAEQLNEAVLLGGRRYLAAFPLGKCLMRLGKYVEAVDALELAVEDEPDRYGVIHLLGKAMRSVGRQDEADAMFAKAEAIRQIRESAT